tara:strand:+ start:2929 stop:3396 length:468 start_codon:yes stop_codon:yes gene_type:complete
MIIESAQMLANVFSLEQLSHPFCPRTQKGLTRKHGYRNHPCTKWVRERKDNARWLIDHTLSMSLERYYRWPESESHFTMRFIYWCENNLAKGYFSEQKEGLSPFAVAINSESKCRSVKGFEDRSTVEKYRLYYRYDKPFATWTKQKKPAWMDIDY